MQYLPSILAALGILCNLCLGLYVFSSNKKAAKEKELQDAINRINTVEAQVKSMPDKVAGDLDLQDATSRLVKLEERVKNMPTHEDISQMRSNISGLQSEVEGMGKILERVETNVNRLTDYLLNNRG